MDSACAASGGATPVTSQVSQSKTTHAKHV